MPEPTKIEEIEAKKVAKQLTTVESLLKDYMEQGLDTKQELGTLAEEFKQLIFDERKREEEEKKREDEENKKREEENKRFEEEFTQ